VTPSREKRVATGARLAPSLSGTHGYSRIAKAVFSATWIAGSSRTTTQLDAEAFIGD
jgi:hypothetical protein